MNPISIIKYAIVRWAVRVIKKETYSSMSFGNLEKYGIYDICLRDRGDGNCEKTYIL